MGGRVRNSVIGLFLGVVVGSLGLACGDSGNGSDPEDAAGQPDAAGQSDGASGSDAGPGPDGSSTGTIQIPAESDWTDQGDIFSAGVTGEWDLYLWGGFATAAVKKDGIYYLYYQGSDGYDNIEDTVTYRAIGVATSTDGLTFTKHAANPVLTWFPNNGIEEGAVSCGVFLESDGQVVLYYGANTTVSQSLVNADGRIATSSDGLVFTDEGMILDHSDGATWGSGDELFPVIGFRAGENYFAYYIPNGSPERAQLGVAWGSDQATLTSTAAAVAGGNPVGAWGPGGWARLEDDRYALFVDNDDDSHVAAKHIDVYVVDPAQPTALTGPVEIYAFSNLTRGTVLLDEETDQWFLYYRNQDSSAYGVRTAPVTRQ